VTDIKNELDKIKLRISDKDFLANKGLSNEVGIHVYCYDPKHELIVRDFITRLSGSPSDIFRIIEKDMYNIFLEILTEKRVINTVAALEEKKGKDYLLAQLQKIASGEIGRAHV
jgi:alanine-alpha-ketoisovalerate/valine-pyruvate aminotransferase